jgi:hypothetical protein
LRTATPLLTRVQARKRASSRFGISPFSLAAERAAAAPAGSSRSAGQAKAPLRGAGQGAAAAAAAAAAFAKRVLPKALAQGGVDVDCDLVMATNGEIPRAASVLLLCRVCRTARIPRPLSLVKETTFTATTSSQRLCTKWPARMLRTSWARTVSVVRSGS